MQSFDPNKSAEKIPEQGHHIRLVRGSGEQREIIDTRTSRDGSVNHVSLFGRAVHDYLWPLQELIGVTFERYTNGKLDGSTVITENDLKVIRKFSSDLSEESFELLEEPVPEAKEK